MCETFKQFSDSRLSFSECVVSSKGKPLVSSPGALKLRCQRSQRETLLLSWETRSSQATEAYMCTDFSIADEVNTKILISYCFR